MNPLNSLSSGSSVTIGSPPVTCDGNDNLRKPQTLGEGEN